MGGGGGGNTTTATSGVPDWLKPQVQSAFKKAEDAHTRGALSRTVDDPEHKAFLAQTAREGLQGANQRQLQNFYGNQLASQAGSGTLGSARGDRAREAALADASSKLAVQDLQTKDQAFGQLRSQAQEAADAEHQGLQRLFGYYGSNAAGKQQTSTQGGGK